MMFSSVMSRTRSILFINAYAPEKETSGILRFARDVAESMSQLDDTETRVVPLPLAGRPSDLRAFRWTVAIRHADRVVVQFSPHLLPARQCATLLLLATFMRGKLIVMLHDSVRPKGQSQGRAGRLTSAALRHLANINVVFNATERESLSGSSSTTHVIPHFVRKLLRVPRDRARDRVGLPREAKVAGVLGFIHERKGHHRALAALEHPGGPDYLILAGAFLFQEYERRLRADIAERDLSHRVIMTGYLSRDEMDVWAGACDVGLCPFVEVSASGSLSDWIGYRKPVVASAFAQLEYYAKRAPHAVLLCDSSNPAELSQAFATVEGAPEVTSELHDLAAELSLSRTARRYRDLFFR